MSKLCGQYQTDKSNLLKAGTHLVIATRRKESPNKPKNYLLLKESGGFKYLSGLYPFTGDLEPISGVQFFSLDYQGEDYLLCLNAAKNEAKISLLPKPTNSPRSINNGELGEDFYPKKGGYAAI